jgi:capsular polysaccharide biosynthesis protein
MAERSPDLRADVAVIRRRWRIIAAAVVLGVGLGVLYTHLVPAQLTSRSLVLLTNGGSSGGGSGDPGAETQVKLVLSTPVLAKAGRAMHPALSATEVVQRVDVQPATSQLLQIDASSPQAKDAQALSQAVADAYVERATANVRSVTGAIVADLKTRGDALDLQVKALQKQIDATAARLSGEDPKSDVGVTDARLQARLQADQADIAKQLDSVKSELADSGAVGTASTQASIAQPAAPATGPDPLFRPVTPGLVGGLLLGVLAAALVALRARRDPRLRTRDDLADAVASSVLADIRSRRQRSVAEWLALFETYVASPVDAWAFRRLLRALSSMTDAASSGQGSGPTSGRLEHPRSVTVVTVAGDVRGLAIAPQLAAFAASVGITTDFLLASSHDAAASMWAACSAERGSAPRPGLRLEVKPEGPVLRDGLSLPAAGSFDELVMGGVGRGSAGEWWEAAIGTIDASDDIDGEPGQVDDEVDDDGLRADSFYEDEETEVLRRPALGPTPPATERLPLLYPARERPAADLTIVLVVADPQEPSLDGVPSTEVTVLALAPGVSTREQLARLAVAVDDAGRRIDGIVVADPDPSDRTTGRHTLDERSRQAPLPLRVTGISSSSVAANERGTGR